MENNYRDYDETYLLFEQFLLSYLPFAADADKIEVNENDAEVFSNLRHEQSVSKSEVQQNWNLEKRMADSLVFWMQAGLIVLEGGKYYINSNQLIERSVQYNDYKKEAKEAVTYHKKRKQFYINTLLLIHVAKCFFLALYK